MVRLLKPSLPVIVYRKAVFYPHPFNVYLNEFIELLSEQGVGCHLHGEFTSAFVYADDITLLAPTSTALNSMLQTCYTFATAYGLRFHSSTTKCMYFSKNNKDKYDNICFMNTSIDFMECAQLVWVFISQTILPIGILRVLYTSFMPKLTVFCTILEMFLVMSK